MPINKKAKHLATFFKSVDVTDGKKRIVLTDNAPQSLRDAVRSAHGDKFPNDFIYATFADLLERIAEYDVRTVDKLRDHGYDHEIVDSAVSVYTSDLLQWLASDVYNVEHLADTLDEYGWTRGDSGYQLLARAQYYAINEVMQHVLDLLENYEIE